jgi:hypothetical protein
MVVAGGRSSGGFWMFYRFGDDGRKGGDCFEILKDFSPSREHWSKPMTLIVYGLL